MRERFECFIDCFFILFCPFIKNSSSACGLCNEYERYETIHTLTHFCVKPPSSSSLFPFFSFFLCLLVFSCLCGIYEIRVFELKSQVKTHAPQHLLHALPGGGRVVGAKAHTHIYTHISNARFRFSFAIERERLTITTTRRRKYASRNVRENAPGLSDV